MTKPANKSTFSRKSLTKDESRKIFGRKSDADEALLHVAKALIKSGETKAKIVTALARSAKVILIYGAQDDGFLKGSRAVLPRRIRRVIAYEARRVAERLVEEFAA